MDSIMLLHKKSKLVLLSVLAAVNEPKPGWIDQPYGMTGVIAGISYGILKTALYDNKLITNVVPVDYVVNALIASCQDVAVQANR